MIKLIRRAIVRSALPRVIVGIVCVSGALLATQSVRAFRTATASAPVEITASLLAQVSPPLPLYNVRAHARRVFATEIMTVVANGSTVNHYYVLIFDDGLLLMSSEDPIDTAQRTWSGSLVPMEPVELSDVYAPVLRGNPEFETRFPRAILRAGGLASENFDTLGVVGLIFGVYGLVLILISTWRASQFKLHPYYRALKRFGSDAEVLTLLEQVEAELPSGKRAGRLTVTDNWVVLADSVFGLMRKVDIVWIYEARERGIIYATTVGRVQVIAVDRLGGKLTAKGSKSLMFEDMSALQDAAPWATVGFSTTNRILWESQRDTFIARVDARRAARSQTPPQS